MDWFSISDYKLISYSDFFTDCPTLKYNNSQVKHVELSICAFNFYTCSEICWSYLPYAIQISES